MSKCYDLPSLPPGYDIDLDEDGEWVLSTPEDVVIDGQSDGIVLATEDEDDAEGAYLDGLAILVDAFAPPNAAAQRLRDAAPAMRDMLLELRKLLERAATPGINNTLPPSNAELSRAFYAVERVLRPLG